MTYQKPQVEIVKFDSIGFMTSSVGVQSFDDLLSKLGGDPNNPTANFSCTGIDCSGSVSINGYTFKQRGGSHNWHYTP